MLLVVEDASVRLNCQNMYSACVASLWLSASMLHTWCQHRDGCPGRHHHVCLDLELEVVHMVAGRGKIVDGRIQKFLSEQALLDQAFIKDTSKTVATVIKEATATIGEKVSIRRFER